VYDLHAWYIVIITGAVTAFLRFLPFIAFSKRRPGFVMYLGRVLPPAVMMMLAVYCLRGVDIFSGSHGIPEGLACLAVTALQIWRRSTLLSITAGTALYMFLVQVIFV